MKYHENHQKRALSVIIAVSSKNKLFVRGLSPTSKSMALAHLDPMWPPSAEKPGGDVGAAGMADEWCPPDILAPALNLDVNLAGFQQHVCTVLFRDSRHTFTCECV